MTFKYVSLRPLDLTKQHTILTPQKWFKDYRLLMVPKQVKAGNRFENLLNEFRQIMYSLYRAKGIAKKVDNNTMNSINL